MIFFKGNMEKLPGKNGKTRYRGPDNRIYHKDLESLEPCYRCKCRKNRECRAYYSVDERGTPILHGEHSPLCMALEPLEKDQMKRSLQESAIANPQMSSKGVYSMIAARYSFQGIYV